VNVYQLDTTIQLNTTFYQSDGVTPVDPSAVNLYIRDPTGAVTEYTGGSITRVDVGVYTFALEPSMSGIWIYKWQGTGAVEITSPDVYFEVEPSAALTG
jgi:hypothetical protein